MKTKLRIVLALLSSYFVSSYVPMSALESERVSPQAKVAETISQLKAGHPDESARLIRELLMESQLALPMDPSFSNSSADLYVKSPQMLKDFFFKILEKDNASLDTKTIIESLINNTIARDYSTRVKAYCSRLDKTLKQLEEFRADADSEALKYGDSLTSLIDDSGTSNGEIGSNVNTTAIEKLAKTLHELATEAQQIPVGDARPALGLYRLALVENSLKNYAKAESYADQSLLHIKSLTDDNAGMNDVQVARAYALLKQHKLDEFSSAKEEILKHSVDRERLLITMARFCELNHDDAEALRIYKIAIDNRVKQNNSQKPEWQNDYDALLERTKQK